MTLPTQTKILRVLQSGTFERVGGNQPMQVDVRVIAATNKPLEEAVAEKEFREDLILSAQCRARPNSAVARAARRTFRLLVNYFLRNSSGKTTARIHFGEAPSMPRSNTIGPATSANSKMSFIARSSWQKVKRFSRRTFRVKSSALPVRKDLQCR